MNNIFNFIQPYVLLYFGEGIVSGIIDGVKNFFTDAINTVVNTLFGPIKGSLVNLIASLYESSNGGIASEMRNWIDLNGSHYTAVNTYCETIYNVFASVGCGLMILFWLIGIIDKLTKDRLNSYALIRAGIELIFGFAIVMNGSTLCKAIADCGTWFANKVTTTTANSSISQDIPFGSLVPGLKKMSSGHGNWSLTCSASTMISQVNNVGAGETMGLIFILLIGAILTLVYYLFSQVVFALMLTVCISRAIQFFIYTCLSSIGVAQWFNHGGIMDSSGMQFIKKLLAISLQGGIILIMLNVIDLINMNLSDATSFPIMSLIALKLVSLAVIKQSQQFANDVIAH